LTMSDVVFKRFLFAFVVAFCVWSLLVSIPQFRLFLINTIYWPFWRILHPGGYYAISPQNVEIQQQCFKGCEFARGLTQVDGDQNIPANDGGPNVWRSTFSLNADADALAFATRDPRLSGSINFVLDSEDASVGGSSGIQAVVDTQYDSFETLENVMFCTGEKVMGEDGIVFSSGHNKMGRPVPDIFFNVTVHLPNSFSDRRHAARSLKTKLPNFAHFFHGDGTFEFASLDIITANAPVQTNATVLADSTNIETSNSPITGTYRTSSNLILTTSNAPIDVTVFAKSNERRHSNEIVLRTSNGYIKAPHTFTTDAEEGGGFFRIAAITSNGEVDVPVLDHPVGARLALSARSSNKAVTASVPTAFEGAFVLRTSNAQPELTRGDDPEDPTGEDRTRHVETNHIGDGAISGHAWWGEEKRAPRFGRDVALHTSNAAVSLTID